ncbi:MAG: CHAT domain-containing protein [Labilithrix sp.]|nr:CHAT domain-containing protein [Labilithrix sp.]
MGSLDVAFAGCAAVAAACELGDARALRLVVQAGAVDVAIESDGRALPAKMHEGAHVVDVPRDATAIVVRARAAGKPARFTLAIAPARRLAWLEDAKAARAKGDLPRARELASPRADAGPAEERAAARGLLARIALAEGRADDAFPLFRAAIAAHRGAGRISDAIDDSFALAFALHQRSHRYGEARAALDDVTPLLPRYPEGRAREPYYRGILASETGDRRAALTLLREAEARARALGMGRLERNARAALALEMQVLGRARASIDVLRALERDPEVKGCERVEVSNDLGWAALLANEAAGERAYDARSPLERAASVDACADAYLKSFALANLARLALTEGDHERARRSLASARAAVTEPRGTERLAWLDLEAHLLLHEKKPAAALARFDEELALARAAVLLEPEWSALVGRAEAFEALGRKPEAASTLLAAEALVDRAMLVVPLGEGRGAFVADRSRSARAAIDLLVELGRAGEAAMVARRSRARVLASVERSLRIERLGAEARARWEAAVRSYRAEREALDADAAGDWKLAADALAKKGEARRERERAIRAALEQAMAVLSSGAPDVEPEARVANGDLDLSIHPTRKGWVALAASEDRVTAHRVPAPGASAAELAAALLDPVAARLSASRRVRVRAYGAWRNVDVHALPWGGSALVDHVAVDYPLGLATRPSTIERERRAVVIGDPTGDLPRARGEAVSVARALEGRMPAKLLVGGDATSRAVTEQIARAAMLHYAGHGVYAGLEGWESALPLAEGGRLAIGDLLALTPAPRRVVLSGCEAARSDGEAEGLGLAQALVAAGADEVLAPIRPVSDAIAGKLAEALYAGAAGDAAIDLGDAGALARAAREALRRLRASDAAGDWAAFRVLAR